MDATVASSSLPIAENADLLCGSCGQNLRGVASDRCPECGQRFDRARILHCVVPWEQRRQIGRFRAYWQTVHLVTFRSKKLTYTEHTVTLRAARLFRAWTVLLLFLTLLIPILTWRLYPNATRTVPRQMLPFNVPIQIFPDLPDLARNAWFFGTSLAALGLWLIAATGVSGWFFHPKGLPAPLQKRGVAISLYAVASLAWLPVLLAFAAIFLWIEVLGEHNPYIFFTSAAIGGTLLTLCALTPVFYWWRSIRLLLHVTGSRIRMIAAALLIPIVWLLLSVLVFVGLQVVVNYAALFFNSLR